MAQNNKRLSYNIIKCFEAKQTIHQRAVLVLLLLFFSKKHRPKTIQSGNKTSKSIATHIALFVAFGTALKAFRLHQTAHQHKQFRDRE
jgi:hypothetical protein